MERTKSTIFNLDLTILLTSTLIIILSVWTLSLKGHRLELPAGVFVVLSLISVPSFVLFSSDPNSQLQAHITIAAVLFRRRCRSKENSARTAFVQFLCNPSGGLFYLWMGVCAVGFFSVLKQCDERKLSWQTRVAFDCQIGTLVLSVLIALHNSVQSYRLNDRCQPRAQESVTSRRSSDIESSLEKSDVTLQMPDPVVCKLNHERWLQRRNSLSSQRAIYPQQSFEPRRSATYSYTPSSCYSRTQRSSFDYGDRASTPSSSASTVRSRYGQPDPNCPAIPESPKQFEACSTPAVPAPAWCPPLNHAPLSADPAIRALSSPIDSEFRAPLIPRRAPGHFGRVSTGTRLALRRPSPLGYRRQKLWTYRPHSNSTNTSMSRTWTEVRGTGSPYSSL